MTSVVSNEDEALTKFKKDNDTIQKVVIRNLVQNSIYRNKIIGKLDTKFFSASNRNALKTLKYFHDKKINLPSFERMIDFIRVKTSELSEKARNELLDTLDFAYNEEEEDSPEFIFDLTKSWLEESNALMMFFEMKYFFEHRDKNNFDDLKKEIKKRLNFSIEEEKEKDFFDEEDVEDLVDYLITEDKDKIASDIKVIDNTLAGGFSKKTLTLFLGGSGVGKSMIMTSLASNMFRQGKNILYITLELSQNEIAKRFASNLLDMDNRNFKNFTKEHLSKKILDEKSKYLGKMIIKEWAINTKTPSDIGALVNDLRLQKGFVPDLIFVDYLGLLNSSTTDKRKDKHVHLEDISKELKSLAQQLDLPIITAQQMTRGNKNVDDVSEDMMAGSYQINGNLDNLFAIFAKEKEDDHFFIKNLKCRQGKTDYRIFKISRDFWKMKIFDYQGDDEVCEANPKLKDIKPYYDKNENYRGELPENEMERRMNLLKKLSPKEEAKVSKNVSSLGDVDVDDDYF